MRKRIGPRTNPCGTPDVTGTYSVSSQQPSFENEHQERCECSQAHCLVLHSYAISKSVLSDWLYRMLSKSLTKSGPSYSKRRKLNKLVKGHFVNCFSGFNTQYSDIFCLKNVSSFCTAKGTHIFFSKKFQHICVSLDVNFNELLTNNVVSFEQLGPGQVAYPYPYSPFLQGPPQVWQAGSHMIRPA